MIDRDLARSLRAIANQLRTDGRDSEDVWVLREAAAKLDPVPTHTHLARGGKYTEIGRGLLQTVKPITDVTKLVAYVGEDGKWWFRPPAEFDDPARFAKL
jgi:hypothetical protein